MSLVFGPIASRRFGRSLGINHLQGKACSYSCIYCQVGPTARTTIARSAFAPTDAIVDAVRAVKQPYDVISFVPDGEPTLDINLGAHIRAVRPFGVPVAVITNGSLLWDAAVRDAVNAADIVSVEIDAVTERAWRGERARERSRPRRHSGVRARAAVQAMDADDAARRT
jgi:wyosine [tRNA(Phe)-imidazoG37] synthetase (radical SAM superfamily)